MPVLTLYFAGSGHGLSHMDDTIVEAYKHTTSPKAFFPGPGGKDPNIYVGPEYGTITRATHLIGTSTAKGTYDKFERDSNEDAR